ncbi:hypothetical protein BO71DRAFT_403123 [Aspergillus ellipticus CBS 707.79]|uniref:Uncharacterized protein n=1 Tax=Aspergillus ellipticus CBS 707.79 TaxID=1448320 RepID=A0A319D4E4_9EURO|nr:hypothetical protein BO71DRAFT_403123 [Aspergillus ellipticus CBS 707.79]
MVAKALSVYVLCDGRLIVGLAASERVFSGWFDEFFREGFNVHWSRGDHCMTEYKLKDDVVLPSGVDPALVRPRFTMHAVLVKNAQPHEKIYVPVPGARDWRFPGDEDKPVDESQAAAVWAPMGRGFVAYCGDLHVDEYAVDLILALCGFKQREVHPSGQEDAVMGESP